MHLWAKLGELSFFLAFSGSRSPRLTESTLGALRRKAQDCRRSHAAESREAIILSEVVEKTEAHVFLLTVKSASSSQSNPRCDFMKLANSYL
jgi:hypothetical protein